MKSFFKKLLLCFISATFIVGGFVIVNNASVKTVQAQETMQAEKIADVYLIAGQSNAVGSTLIANGAGPAYKEQNNNSYADSSIKYENVLYNHHAHPTTKGSGYMITNFVPVTQGLGYTPAKNHIGPELGIAKYLDPIYAKKENTDAIIIKVAAGGTVLTRHYDDADLDIEALREQNSYDANFGTWYPESLWNVRSGDLKVDLWDPYYYRHPTGLLYRELITFVKNNYQWLQDEGYTKINFKALCWMQGCSDRGREAEYKVAFNAFMGDIRRQLTDLTGEDYSNFPVVSGEISKTFSSAASQPTNEKFIAMQHEIAFKLNQSYVIPTKDFLINGFDEYGKNVVLGSDSAHWNYEDMYDIGYLFGEKLYNVNSNDKWIYFDYTAKRNDHTDKTTLENVKLDIAKFNEDGEISFECDLKKVYNITSLQVKDGIDLMPYLSQTVDGNMRKYVVSGAKIANTKDITLQAHFTNADTYNVSVSIAEDGSGYGDKIYTYEPKVYANAGQYSLTTHPATDGRVLKVTINGIEVKGAKNQQVIEIENIFDYLNGQTEFRIEVQYSPIPNNRIEASGYTEFFEKGEPFSTGDLVVKFLDPLDNETIIDPSQYTVSAPMFNSNAVGDYLVNVTWGSYSCTYTVTVVALTVEVENPKNLFLLGEQFSLGDAKIYLISKAGRVELSAGQYSVMTALFNSNYAGTYNIIVSTSTASGSYQVKVVAPTSISVSGAKTEFGGEEFTTGDIVVKAMVDGEEIILDESQYTVDSSAFKQTEAGSYVIKVKAGGKTAKYTVTVESPEVIEVENARTNFMIGESFSIGNGKIYLVSNGERNELSAGQYTINSSAFNSLSAGTYDIMVSYNGTNGSYQVKVAEPTSILVSGATTKFGGEAFTTGDIVVKAMVNGEEVTLGASLYTVDSSAFNQNVTGNYEIVVSAGGKTAKYTVSVVIPTLEVSNVKTSFILGESFSIGNGKIYLVTKDGRNELSAGQYSINSSAFNANNAGTYEITVNYNGTSVSYQVSVVAPTSISVSGAKTEFSGEEFTTGDIVVKAMVSGEEVTLDASLYTVDSSAFKQNKNGSYEIVVSAGGKTAKYTVTVSGIKETSSGCGANAMEIFSLVLGLCAIAFVFKKK